MSAFELERCKEQTRSDVPGFILLAIRGGGCQAVKAELLL